MAAKRKLTLMKIEDFYELRSNKKVHVDLESGNSFLLLTMENTSSKAVETIPEMLTQVSSEVESSDGAVKKPPKKVVLSSVRNNELQSHAISSSHKIKQKTSHVSLNQKSESLTKAEEASSIKRFISQRRKVKSTKMEKNELFVLDDYENAISAQKLVKAKTGVLFDHEMGDHKCLWDKDYPENPNRYFSIIKRCAELKLFERCIKLDSIPATKSQIELLHATQLFDKLDDICASTTHLELENHASNYDSVYFHKETLNAALIAAGAAICLVDKICQGVVQNGFAIIRPPGHHAMVDSFCGYCFFNNVALAAKHALDNKLATKILIVDFDVHHGQATQRMFYEDKRVLYFSIHRFEHGEFWPHLRESNYDFIGKDEGLGYNVNVPLNATGLGDSEYMTIVTQLLLPLGYEFQPDLIMVSAGYDACIGCPEGQMKVTPGFYGHLIRLLSGLANGKIAVCLEGGYFLPSLAEGAAMTLKSLLGDPLPMLEPITAPNLVVVEVIDSIKLLLGKIWNSFNITKSKAAARELKYSGVPLVAPFPTRNCYLTNPPDQIEMFKQIVASHCSRNDKLGDNQIVACCYDPDMLKHTTFKNVAEKPERLLHAYNLYNEWGLSKRCLNLKPKPIDASIIKLIHSQGYVDNLLKNKLEELTKKDADMYYNDSTLNAVVKSAGSVLAILDSVMNNQANSGAAFVRPPGHHAEVTRPMGFCFINNVALAAQYAIDHYSLDRVLILDFDIHHGNGIQNIFYESKKVLYMSIHKYEDGKFFPGTDEGSLHHCGKGLGVGYNVNIPLSQYKYNDEDYLNIFYHIVLPVAYSYAPQLILISAGFDAGVNDLLGNYKITPECFGHFVQLVKPLASGKVILVMEGGYNPTTVKYSMNICVKTLLGDPLPMLKFKNKKFKKRYINVIKKVLRLQKKAWPALLVPVTTGSSESQTGSESEVITEDLQLQNLAN